MSQIKITYKNTDYILEYSRKTASQIEQRGLKISEIGDKPNTMLPLLIQGAFLKNCPKVKTNKIEEIYNEISDKSKFIEKLVEMYSETLDTLMTDNDKGNATWETI